MNEKYNIAILGATGAVGETVMRLLLERNFPVDKLYLLASENSAGQTRQFGDQTLTVLNANEFDFQEVGICFSAVDSNVIIELASRIVEAGCLLIDKSSAFRQADDVPLIVPEVNLNVLYASQSRLVAVPNCSTIPIVVALKPLHDAVGITRINVATYQSVSGAGVPGLQALQKQTLDYASGRLMEVQCFSKPIAFNVIPCIDDFLENGYTKEEMKVVWETQKILQDPNIAINVTAVRVPVFYGHAAAVHIETRDKIIPEQAMELWAQMPSIQLSYGMDYPTPLTHAAGTDPIYIGRVRKDLSHPNGLNFWVTADNLRKGAALNAVQIAEALINEPPVEMPQDLYASDKEVNSNIEEVATNYWVEPTSDMPTAGEENDLSEIHVAAEHEVSDFVSEAESEAMESEQHIIEATLAPEQEPDKNNKFNDVK